MELLICCATSEELKTVKAQIKNLNFKKHLDIHYLCTGIGSYETIYNLTNYLKENKDILEKIFLVNIGICGYKKKGGKKVIQIGRIKNLTTNKELLVPQMINFGKIESIYFSEDCLLKPFYQIKNPGYFDTESRAIEFCCEKFKIPRILIKVPSINVGNGEKTINKKEILQILTKDIDYGKLIESISLYFPNERLDIIHQVD